MTPRDDERAGAAHCFARFVSTRGLKRSSAGVPSLNWKIRCRGWSCRIPIAFVCGKRCQKCVPSLVSATYRQKPREHRRVTLSLTALLHASVEHSFAENQSIHHVHVSRTQETRPKAWGTSKYLDLLILSEQSRVPAVFPPPPI